MTLIQQFLTTLLPKAWAEAMRAESLRWMVRCSCGFERSIWDIGGIRWKAKGTPRRRLTCPQCGQIIWHTMYLKPKV